MTAVYFNFIRTESTGGYSKFYLIYPFPYGHKNYFLSYCSSWDFLPSSFLFPPFIHNKSDWCHLPNSPKYPPITHSIFILHFISILAHCRLGSNVKGLAGFLGEVKEEETLHDG